ncbi:MAG: hypothetical protein R3F47_15485 [Gammaproteobacteria bacterium]
MKPLYRGLAVAVAAVGIAACVKQAWRVTYEGPDDYSMGTAVLAEDGGNAYMSGYLDDRSIFLAAYNASGKKLWDRVIEGDGFVRTMMGRTLEQDAQGNLYLLQWDSTFQGTLFKFDADGNQVFSVILPESEYLGHMQLLDGALYLTPVWGSRIAAYDLDGQLLWSYSPASVGNSGDADLPVYPGVSQTEIASSNSSNGYLALVGGARLIKASGQLYFNLGDEVVVLDDAGNVTDSIGAAMLGVDDIQAIMVNGNGLMLLGAQHGALVSVALDATLVEQSRSELSAQSTGGVVVSSQGDVLCAGFNGSDAQGSSVFRMFQLSAAGQAVWSQSIPRDGISWEFADVLSDGNACYLTVQVLQDGNRLLTRTNRFNGAGVVTDNINLQDFGLSGVAVHGKGVYHVGITGEYDGSVTIATLDKQPLK